MRNGDEAGCPGSLRPRETPSVGGRRRGTWASRSCQTPQGCGPGGNRLRPLTTTAGPLCETAPGGSSLEKRPFSASPGRPGASPVQPGASPVRPLPSPAQPGASPAQRLPSPVQPLISPAQLVASPCRLSPPPAPPDAFPARLLASTRAVWSALFLSRVADRREDLRTSRSGVGEFPG